MCEKHTETVDEEVETEDNVTCANCSRKIDLDDAFEENGDSYCDDCTNMCQDCENTCVETHTVQDRRYNDVEVCESCRDSNYYHCEDCGIDFHENANHGNNSNGDTVCESCAGEYFYCESCDETYHNNHYGSDGVCQNCEQPENEADDCSLVNSYDYAPRLEFFGTGPYYMGMELETESSSGELDYNAEYVLRKLGNFVYLKSDGSLDNGFEIVSHPATLEEHKKRWVELLDNVPSCLGSKEYSSCGLHIHASRRHLSQLTIGKILAFINAKSNKKFVKEIAQRDCASYAKLDQYKTIKDVKYPVGRYEALNLTNRDTIEFRIFKGTLVKEHVFRASEFVDAIIKFCERAQNKIDDCVSHSKFMEFVAKRKKDYPELLAFCSSFKEE